MGLGGTAKKLQKVANMAEDLYARLNDLREQLMGLRETVERTNTEVDQLRYEHEVTRALLERVAEQQGIDVDEVIENVDTNAPDQATPGQGQGQGQHGQGYDQGQGQGYDQGQGQGYDQGQGQGYDQGQGQGYDQGRRQGQGTAQGPSSSDRRPQNG
ncbi:DUF5798 family protein [Halocatena marina]|uniref:DUF5798 family protein n=1 Tax=Halocatena marina TaxID=2934937 RepID=UPI0022258008|nr:DUF5798 family protein [Halocatena marina]